MIQQNQGTMIYLNICAKTYLSHFELTMFSILS